jgi:hypothetical protein
VSPATRLLHSDLDASPIALAAASRPARVDAPLFQWMLRVACTLEFVGHGAFGLITKAGWVPYFAVVGFPEWLAYRLMPVIGTVDVTLGLVVALRPVRAALLYMALWGFLTALMRPLSGEPVWELLERTPNWAVPLAFLYVRGIGRSWREWLS